MAINGGTNAKPIIEVMPDGGYRLGADYAYAWDHSGKMFRLVIPGGCWFDLASIPRIFWPILSPTELGLVAPLVHDWMIFCKGDITVYRLYPGWQRLFRTQWTRRDVDRLFFRIMREQGIPRWKRRAAFKAVRLWAWWRVNVLRRGEW